MKDPRKVRVKPIPGRDKWGRDPKLEHAALFPAKGVWEWNSLSDEFLKDTHHYVEGYRGSPGSIKIKVWFESEEYTREAPKCWITNEYLFGERGVFKPEKEPRSAEGVGCRHSR